MAVAARSTAVACVSLVGGAATRLGRALHQAGCGPSVGHVAAPHDTQLARPARAPPSPSLHVSAALAWPSSVHAGRSSHQPRRVAALARGCAWAPLAARPRRAAARDPRGLLRLALRPGRGASSLRAGAPGSSAPQGPRRVGAAPSVLRVGPRPAIPRRASLGYRAVERPSARLNRGRLLRGLDGGRSDRGRGDAGACLTSSRAKRALH